MLELIPAYLLHYIKDSLRMDKLKIDARIALFSIITGASFAKYIFNDIDYLIYLFILILCDTLLGIVISIRDKKFDIDRLYKLIPKIIVYGVLIIVSNNISHSEYIPSVLKSRIPYMLLSFVYLKEIYSIFKNVYKIFPNFIYRNFLSLFDKLLKNLKDGNDNDRA